MILSARSSASSETLSARLVTPLHDVHEVQDQGNRAERARQLGQEAAESGRGVGDLPRLGHVVREACEVSPPPVAEEERALAASHRGRR